MAEWNDATKSQLRQLWDQGLSSPKIGKAMGFSKNAIIGMAHRMNLNARPPAIKTGKKPSDWPADKKAAFVLMWENEPHLTRQEMGDRLGCSLAAIIGHQRRMGLQPRVQQSWKTRATTRPTLLKKTTERTPKAVSVAPSTPATEAPEPFFLASLPTATVSNTRPPGACCWPLWGHNERPTHRYCDGPSLVGMAYCPAHASVAYAGTAATGGRFQLRMIG
jgi:GcrA cell cycle regulator